jgi:hypothetical protein
MDVIKFVIMSYNDFMNLFKEDFIRKILNLKISLRDLGIINRYE